jgi:hypothetical protein
MACGLPCLRGNGEYGGPSMTTGRAEIGGAAVRWFGNGPLAGEARSHGGYRADWGRPRWRLFWIPLFLFTINMPCSIPLASREIGQDLDSPSSPRRDRKKEPPAARCSRLYQFSSVVCSRLPISSLRCTIGGVSVTKMLSNTRAYYQPRRNWISFVSQWLRVRFSYLDTKYKFNAWGYSD